MPQPEARAWWADVQHVRESIERRRAASDRREGAARRVEDYAPRWNEGGWADELTQPGRRFARDDERIDADDTAARDGERLRAHPTAHQQPPRRTVEITGRTVPAPLARVVHPDGRRRPPRRAAERVARRPDRVALWAVGLAFFLILVAATSSSQAATPPAGQQAPALIAHAPSR